ncbi:helix-turn-helix domain-containing protein [Halobacillus rhizosphaerae]|uniref:TrmB family transcriptional regulator n=1 Tax=Halobacillus rhizosphaerae TaxID=3064889 RepID=UPI00398A9BB4
MLQPFGFTQYESKVYEALITVNEALDATTIVKRSGVPRSKVYEVLQRMTDKGMILESTADRKRLYYALPVEATIDKLKADFESNVEDLKNIPQKDVEADDRVWTLKEDQSILSMQKELMGNARKSIVISGWADDLEPYIPVLEGKSNEGVEVEVHSTGAIETTLSNVSILIPNSLHEALERSRILIIDNQEVMFAGKEHTDWQAMHTQSKPLVKFFTEFFYHDVALTEITRKYSDTILKDEGIRELLLKLRY